MMIIILIPSLSLSLACSLFLSLSLSPPLSLSLNEIEGQKRWDANFDFSIHYEVPCVGWGVGGAPMHEAPGGLGASARGSLETWLIG